MPRNPIERVLRPLRTRITLAIARAAVRLIDDAKKLQAVQADLGAADTRDGLEHFQSYGFTSKAKPPSGNMGPEGIALAVGGDRAHTIVICVDDRRFRLRNLEDGEVALYDDLGQVVHLKRDGIVIDGAGIPVTIRNCETLEVDANLHVTGDVEVDGDVIADGDVNDQSGTAQSMAAMRTVYNAHTHSVPGITTGPSNATAVPPTSPM